MAAGMAIWAMALVAPAGVHPARDEPPGADAGLRRRARRAHARRPPRSCPACPTTSSSPAASSCPTVDRSRTSSSDPFGAAVVRELPPAAAVRIQNGNWQLRTQRGWISLEDPLHRTVRDSERVRRWLAHDDADFVVKTYAAVISRDLSVARTAACAVRDARTSWPRGSPPCRRSAA